MPDKITEAFSAVKSTGLFLDEKDFRDQLNKSPKDVFSTMSSTGLFIDYDDFENSLGLKKKEPSVPSAPVSGQPSSVPSPSPSQLPSEPKLTYNDIENIIVKAKKAYDNYNNWANAGSNSAGTGAPGYIVPKEKVDAAKAQMDAAMAEKDRIIQTYAKDINKPVEVVINQGKVDYFFDGDVFDPEKGRKFIEDYTKKYGGGKFLQEQMLANLKTGLEAKKDEPILKKFVNEELAARGIDKNFDYYQSTKFGEDLFKKKISNQIKSADQLQAEVKQKASVQLDDAKNKATQLSTSFTKYVESLNQAIQSGRMTEQQAREAYNTEFKNYEAGIKSINDAYQRSIRDINVNLKNRYARIQQEVETVRKSITPEVIQAAIPKEDKQKIIEAYTAAAQKLALQKDGKRKAMDIVGGINVPGGQYTSVLSKSLVSGFSNAIASFGDQMLKNGISNDFSKWLSSFSKEAEQFQTGQYGWDTPLLKISQVTGSTVGGSLPVMVPTMIAASVPGLQGTAAAMVGGTVAAISESAQESGGQFRESLAKGADIVTAEQKADKVFDENMKNLPLYMIGTMGDLMLLGKTGIGAKIKGLGFELAEELPLTVRQEYEKAKLDGYNKPVTTFIKENPDLLVDTFVGTIGMGATLSGVGKAYTAITGKTSSPATQSLQDIIDKAGIEAARKVVNLQFENGIIDESVKTKALAEIDRIANTSAKLADAGITGDKSKLLTSLADKEKALKVQVQAEQDAAVKAVLQDQLTKVQADIKGVTDGSIPYITFTLPGGNNMTRVLTANEFNALPQDQKDEVVKAADKISVTGDDQLQTQLNESKSKLGNMPLPEGAYTNGQELSKTESGMAVDQAGQLTINRDGIKSNAAAETDRIKLAAPEEETGVTMNLDGTTYTGGGLVIPAASMNTTQEELTPDMLADFIEQNKSKLGDGETFKVGYYKFKGSNKVSIDLNIVADPKNRETALRFGRMAGQESLFDLDTKENVKTGADGMNPRNFSDQEFAEIAKSLRDGKLPSFMDTAARARSFIFGEENVKENVESSLRSTGIKIVELSGDEFRAAAEANGRNANDEAFFIQEKGEIVLDKDRATGTTKIHEGAHPVMNIIYNTNRSLYNQAVAGMKRAAATNKGIQGAIEFGQLYDGKATQDDEALVETIARIGSGDIDINTIETGFKQSIIDLVNRIAKIFGYKQWLNDTDVTAFKKLAARVAEVLKEGRDISEVVGDTNIRKFNTKSKVQASVAGRRLFNEPNPKTKEVAKEYKASAKIFLPEGDPITSLDVERSKRIADAYDRMKHDPSNPEVKAAYNAMAKETIDQYNTIAKSGVVFEIFEGNGEPYKNSEEMIKDVRDNNHLYILSTEKEFGGEPITDKQREDNPLLQDSGITDVNGKPLLVNDVFRGVHDYFGHTERGNSFGPLGEENAWDVHARMYSPLARRAMTTETRGQNSWVNFGKHMRNADGSIKKKGDEGFLSVTERPFAEQKIGLLPEEFSKIDSILELGKGEKVKVEDAGIDKSNPLYEGLAKKFKTIEVYGGRPSEGAAIYDSNTKTIKINKNSPFWSETSNTQEAILHEYVHSLIQDSPNKNKVMPILEEMKEEMKGMEDLPRFSEYIISDNNSAEEVATYGLTNKEVSEFIEDSELKPKMDEVRGLLGVQFSKSRLTTEESTSSGLMAQSETIKNTLGLSDEASDVLSIIYNSDLSPVEKKILYRQWDRGVMNIDDIKKFTTIDINKVREGNIDKWARVILEKNKGKRVTAEDIEFEEVTSNNADNRIQASKGNQDFKLAAFVIQERAAGTPDAEIRAGIKEVLPNISNARLDELFADPEGYANRPKPKTAKGVKTAINKAVDTRVKDNVVMNELQALKKQLKDFAKGFRSGRQEGFAAGMDKGLDKGTKQGFKVGIQEGFDIAKSEEKKVETMRQYLRDRVQNILNKAADKGAFTGEVRGKVLNAAIKRLNAAKTPGQMMRFIEYLTNLMSDVEYDAKLQKAESVRASIKKALKRKDRNASTKAVLSEFAKIKPSLVQDLDSYTQLAEAVLSVANGVRVTGSQNITINNQSFDVDNQTIEEYTDAYNEYREAVAKENFLDMYSDLVDQGIIDPTSMSMSEMEEIVDAIFSGDIESMEDKPDKVYWLRRMVNGFREVVAGYNDIDMTPEEQRIFDNLMNLDLENLNMKQLVKLNEILNEIAVNRSFTGAGELAMLAESDKAVKSALNDVKKSGIKFGDIDNFFVKGFASMSLMNEFIFKSSKLAAEIQRKLGITDLWSGYTRAKKFQEQALREYLDIKKGMKDADSAYNRYVRGVVADVMNNFGGTEEDIKVEFDRRKGWIKATYERLKSSDVKREVEEGNLIEKIYNDILEGSEDVDDVIAKTSKDNLKLVEFWRNKFAERRDALAENAALYNNQLFEDVDNYTSTSLRGYNNNPGIKGRDILKTLDDAFVSKRISYKESGTKKKKARAPQPPQNSVLDLDFDSVQSKRYYESNFDIETSKAVIRLKQVMSHPDHIAVFGNSKNAKIVKESIVNAYNLQRGAVPPAEEWEKAVTKTANILQAKGVRIALGSASQLLKQYPSVAFSTLINLGTNMDLFVRALTVSNNIKLFDNYNIGNRGDTQAGFNKELDYGEIDRAVLENSYEKIASEMDKLGKKLADMALASLTKSDVSVARTSWLAYYMQSLREQGVDLNTVDWNTEHENPNEQAAAFAEQMVSRTQNANDASSLSRVFSSQESGVRILRSVALPFSSFSVNQRVKMTNDMQKLLFGGEKVEAAKSLAATAAEITLFNAVKVYIISALTTAGAKSLAQAVGLLGGDDDDEIAKQLGEKIKKSEENRSELNINGLIVSDKQKKVAANALSDYFFSGMGGAPQEWLQRGANYLYSKNVKETLKDGKVNENPTLYFTPDGKGMDWRLFGTSGIAPEKVSQMIESFNKIHGGVDYYTKGGMNAKPAGTVQLTPAERRAYAITLIVDGLSVMGVGDADLSVMNQKLKSLADRQIGEKYGGRETEVISKGKDKKAAKRIEK